MKVFVSSTCYDLLDVRSEIEEVLRDLEIVPVLSDCALSDFAVTLDSNSIETCLVNVRDSDEVIVILDRRYGPTLDVCGYGPVSATNLEYREAKRHSKPIHFFVRDRFESDYQVWKKNKRQADLNLPWVNDLKDFGLFELFEEHKPPKKGAKKSNWYTTFRNSIELKSVLRRRFETRISQKRLANALAENRFPLCRITVEVDEITVGIVPSLQVNAEVRNVGGSPAFSFVVNWEDEPNQSKQNDLLPPGESMPMVFIYGLTPGYFKATKILVITY